MEATGSKRKNDDQDGQIVLKKQKLESGGELAIRSTSNALIPAGIQRTSNLEAPIMLLTGHSVSKSNFRIMWVNSNE